MEQGFTFLKMDLGIELLLDEPGCLNAPLGFLEDIKKYSMKAINHQKGSVDMDMMLGENYETFTIPHHATGIHMTHKGMDYLEDYVKQVRDVIGYEVPLAIDHFGHVCIEDCIMFAKRLKNITLRGLKILRRGTIPNTLKRFQMRFVCRFAQAKIFILRRISARL